jgi:nitrite reductase (NAD(P)H)
VTPLSHQTYECEWTRVVKEPHRRKQFRQFVNTPERARNIEVITERNQPRPADWPKEFPTVKMTESMIDAGKDEWSWQQVCRMEDLNPTEGATTSCSVKIGDSQIAIFNVPKKGLFASQQQCPHKRAMVLDHGIIGEDKDKNPYVSCPLHKRNFNLKSGDCLNDADLSIVTFQAKEQDGDIYPVKLWTRRSGLRSGWSPKQQPSCTDEAQLQPSRSRTRRCNW